MGPVHLSKLSDIYLRDQTRPPLDQIIIIIIRRQAIIWVRAGVLSIVCLATNFNES